jgi:hypothetical protein
VCTPIAAQPLITHHGGVKAKFDRASGDPVADGLPMVRTAVDHEFIRRCGPLPTGPPVASSRHLDGVILRL